MKLKNSMIKSRKPRKVQKITKCEHINKKYYSKGLCQQCYNRQSHNKLATACPHTDRKLYARRVCKACYIKLTRLNWKLSDSVNLCLFVLNSFISNLISKCLKQTLCKFSFINLFKYHK